MKSIKIALGVVLLALLSVVPAQAQIQPGGSPLHQLGGTYYSAGYANWSGRIVQGNSGTGAGSIIIVAAPSSLGDGYAVPATSLFNTNVAISINDANAETFTPSAVSVGVCPAGFVGFGSSSVCATVTGTIANLHGPSAIVTSGDQGVQEALTDAAAQGGGLVFWQVDTGIVTLSTSALTTTTTTFVPSQFINMGASARVTTTITTSTNWATGIASHTSAFTSVNTGLTAGTTSVATQVAPTLTGTSTAMTAILVTVTGANAGAGAIKERVWGYTTAQASQ